MKKIKLLTPILGLTALAGATIPLASCACAETQIKPELINSSTGVKIKDSNIVKGKESTIQLEIPSGKVIETIEVKIGNKVLTKGTDFTIDSNNKITIKASAVDGGNVTVKVTTKDAVTDLELASTLDIAIDGESGPTATISAKLITETSNGEKIQWSVAEEDKDKITIDKTETASEEPITVTGKTLGQATLQAKYGSFTKTCTVDVGCNETTILESTGKVYKADMTTICVHDEEGTVKIKGTLLETNEDKEWERATFNEQIVFGKNTKQIADYFMYCSSQFNNHGQPLVIPSGVTSTGIHFLGRCSTFNQAITIPSSVTSIGNCFLYQCGQFNQPITIPSSVTSIGGSFLAQCKQFNQPITIPSSVTSIGDCFMTYCKQFNKAITFAEGSQLESIGGSFLESCSAFNQPITIPSGVKSINEDFLRDSTSFNQTITIPNSVTSIGNYVLYQCGQFNQPITIPSSVTKIGNYFMTKCSTFDKAITFAEGSQLESIGYSFLEECSTFNQPITIPSRVESIGESFLRSCQLFDKAITFAEGSQLGSIESNFLYQCGQFNQPITIPSSVTKIGGSFLSECGKFNQTITIPSGVKSIGYNFLNKCNEFENTIDFSAVNPNEIRIDDCFLEEVPDANTITFKVASGTISAWQTKLQEATGKSSLPGTWTFVEV